MVRSQPTLSDWARGLLTSARRAVLTTLDDGDGRPRSVPICFALLDEPGQNPVLVSPLDDKPKASTDPLRLRRVRNLAADPRSTILVDNWSEDWSALAFLEISCRGELAGPGDAAHAASIEALRQRYPQYTAHRLEERPILRFTMLEMTSWTARGAPPDPSAASGTDDLSRRAGQSR